MAPKNNPLKLNKLQLKTLTLLQELAIHPESGTPEPDTGNVTISTFPNPHGDHFHLGSGVVMSKDANGLRNEAVWTALARKGLAIPSFPLAIKLTPAGLNYDTGAMSAILHKSDH
jgi:hypothetical protein